MGQKMHPHGLRVGVIKDWNSKWYADSKNFSDYLIEDHKISQLPYCSVGRITCATFTPFAEIVT